MIDETPLPPDSTASAAPTTDDADETASDEFRQALESHERDAQDPGRGTEAVLGSKVTGKIVSIGDESTLVDFGGRSEGVVETKHLRDDAGALRVAVGEAIELFVVEAGDQTLLAPSLAVDPRDALRQARAARAAGIPVPGRVTGLNAGGLAVDVAGVHGFCPVSQVEAGFCADPSVYVGRTLDFLVTEVDEARHSLVLSRKALLKQGEAEQAKQLLATLKPGDEIEGTVARLEPFGAFVNLGGADGMVHVSEISHERVAHPRDALAVGNKVRVRVLRVESGKDGRPKIALSIKAATPDPWTADLAQRFTVGSRVRGKVARLTDFGAFVTLAPGIDGLVHVSEAAAHRIAHVKEVLTQGQEIEAVVKACDPAKRRISLSIRETLDAGTLPRAPKVGDVVDGMIAGIQPYGLFVDLPDYGRRTRGLAPREETGEPRGSDLGKKFSIGTALQVEVISIDGDRIRLRLAGVTPSEPRGDRGAERGPRGERGAERGPRGERGAERGPRGERGAERGPRGARGEREPSRGRSAERAPAMPARPDEPAELTTMAIALREAMARAKAKQGG